MLVSCSYCSSVHPRGHVCRNKPQRVKESNKINSFRWSRPWKNKSKEIRERDKHLCQACILDKRYIFDNLEVHHIQSIAEAWHKRLDNLNLISLCAACHKKAENKSLDVNLFEIAAQRELSHNSDSLI